MEKADATPEKAQTFKCSTFGSRMGSLLKFFQAKLASAWVLTGPGRGSAVNAGTHTLGEGEGDTTRGWQQPWSRRESAVSIAEEM